LYAIVLAGGYATRLWPLTKGTPKALLPIAGKPILNYIIEKLQAINPPLSSIIVSTNLLFQPQFEGWLTEAGYKNIEFFPDLTSSENDKPGAIMALATIVDKMPQDDVLVIGGDGMFNDDLLGFFELFRKKQASVIVVYTANTIDEAKRSASVSVGRDDRILTFIEKPVEPKTKMVSGALYLLKKGVNNQLKAYLDSNSCRDQPGRFVEWLYRQEPVYGYMLKDCLWDIGTPDAYHACDAYFEKELKKEKIK
jgi:glucose-1-phosphate thymidylyltransferase